MFAIAHINPCKQVSISVLINNYYTGCVTDTVLDPF